MKKAKMLGSLAILAVVALSVQGLWRYHLPHVPFLCPQLVLIIIFYSAFHVRNLAGLFLAFLLGLLTDFSSGLLIGPWAGAYTVVYALLALISQGVFTEALITIILGAFFSSLIASATYVLLSFSFTGGTSAAFFGVLVESVVTAIAAPFLFAFIRWVFEKLGLYRLASRW